MKPVALGAALMLGLTGGGDSAIGAPICEDPITAEALAGALEAGRTHFFLMEGDKALEALESAEDRLGCARDPLGADILVPFYQYLGAIYLSQDQLPEAKRAMERAAHLSEDLTWDPALENRAQALFLQVKAEQLQSGVDTISAGEDPAFDRVRFNGRSIGPGDVIPGVSAGDYYVQRDFGDDGHWGGWVTLGGDGPWGLLLVTGGVTAEPLPEAPEPKPGVVQIAPDYLSPPPRGVLTFSRDPYFPALVGASAGALVTGTLFVTLNVQRRVGVFDNTIPQYPALKRVRGTSGILTLGLLATAAGVGVNIHRRSDDGDTLALSLSPGGLGLRMRF